MARILKVTGVAEDRPITKLKEMQDAVGGFIEWVPFAKVQYYNGKAFEGMLVNEEGKLKDLPVNMQATNLVNAIGIRDVIVGDAVLMEPGEME